MNYNYVKNSRTNHSPSVLITASFRESMVIGCRGWRYCPKFTFGLFYDDSAFISDVHTATAGTLFALFWCHQMF